MQKTAAPKTMIKRKGKALLTIKEQVGLPKTNSVNKINAP